MRSCDVVCVRAWRVYGGVSLAWTAGRECPFLSAAVADVAFHCLSLASASCCMIDAFGCLEAADEVM